MDCFTSFAMTVHRSEGAEAAFPMIFVACRMGRSVRAGRAISAISGFFGAFVLAAGVGILTEFYFRLNRIRAKGTKTCEILRKTCDY
jgi:hypothetical protein